MPRPVERSTYVLLATAALALLMWQWRPLPEVVRDVQAQPWRTVLYAVSFGGWGLLLGSTFLIDHFHLFGLQQVTRHVRGQQQTDPAFTTPLVHRLVRHPLMLGFLIAFWSAPTMTVGHLLFAVATTGYILVALQLEERDLEAAFGDRYRRYQQDVPMLVPGVRPREPHVQHYWGPALSTAALASIDVAWTAPMTLRVTMDAPSLTWDVALEQTRFRAVLNAVHGALPAASRRVRPLVAAREWVARWLGLGAVSMSGRLPTGGHLVAALQRLYWVSDSTARLEGTDLGRAVILPTCPTIGGWPLPRRGVYVVGEAHATVVDDPGPTPVRPTHAPWRTPRPRRGAAPVRAAAPAGR